MHHDETATSDEARRLKIPLGIPDSADPAQFMEAVFTALTCSRFTPPVKRTHALACA